MRIYTKTGDKGETSLYKGGRVPKDAPRLEAYGTLDELNAHLGLARALAPAGTDLGDADAQLRRIQRDLFCLGAQLATLGDEPPAWRITAEDVTALERAIDAMEAELPPLTTFILPGGHPMGAALHVARTVARRAERLVVGVAREDALDPLIVTYVNRLSDHLFVLARFVSRRAGTPEAVLEI
jgi:cob(I)alamin adenosyltransferase